MRFYNQAHRFYCGVDPHARTMYSSAVSSGRPSRRLTPLTCLAPPHADTSDGTSPMQQTRTINSDPRDTRAEGRNPQNSGVRPLTREAINRFCRLLDAC
jgi:hypothetical protein